MTSALFSWNGFPQFLHHNFHIFPHRFFHVGVSKEEGRVVGGHQFDALGGNGSIQNLLHPRGGPQVKTASKTGDFLFGGEQCLGGEITETDDHLWMDRLDLLEKKRRASGDFVGGGVSVFRRAAFHDVRYIDIASFEPHRLDDFGEELPGPSHEGFTFQIFIATRAFAHKHEFGLRISDSKDEIRPALVETATGAVADVVTKVLEGIAF